MKPLLFGAILLIANPVIAQYDYGTARVGQSADELKRASVRLAARTLQDITRGFNNSRGDIQEALLAQQIDGGATLLVEMVRARRPGRELADVVSDLSDMARRAPWFSATSGLWRPVQNAISNLERELGGIGRGPFPGPPNPGPPSRPIIGRVTWRGAVDDRVQLVIRGRTVETRVVSGQARPEGTANFTSPLPNTPVDVSVNRLDGRGSVRVLQQPSRANDFTAVIEIYDNNPGAQEYRLDIYWQAPGR